MKQLLLSTIILLMLSVTLTACSTPERTIIDPNNNILDGDGSGDGDGDGNNTTFTPSNDFTLNPLGVIDEFTATDVDIPTYKDGANDVAYDSLTKIATDATAENTIDVTLHGLAVLKNDSTAYTRENTNIIWADKANDSKLQIDKKVTLSRITAAEKSPAVTLTFDADGAISGITAYVDETRAMGNDGLTITADRKDIFGFTSNYMAYISWHLPENRSELVDTDTKGSTSDISGAMLAGIEIADIASLSADNITFTGRGRGSYGSETENYNTVFDVTATVNFGATKNVKITSSATCKDVENAVCTDNGADRLDAKLDFTTGDTAIIYTGNAISGDVTASVLSGTLDARFYGGFAWELGGTFALAHITSKSYYFGVFGAKRDEGIITPLAFNKDAITTPLAVSDDEATKINAEIAKNNASYISLADVADASGSNRFTMNALSVYKDDITSYRRAPNRDWVTEADMGRTIDIARLAGSAASLTFNNSGNISSVKVYLNGKNYTANIANPVSETNVSMAPITEGADSASTATIDVRRASDYFSFKADYMAYIDWALYKDEDLTDTNTALEENGFYISGAMLAGIETADIASLSAEAVGFTGKGSGTYDANVDDDVAGYDTIFDVTATVNFGGGDVTIYTESTECKVANCTTDILGQFDLEADAIGYSDNDISGDVTTFSPANNLSGRLDARFYGIAAREFGGTFALTEINDGIYSYYYGVFGAKRDDYVAFSNPTPIATDTMIGNETVPTDFDYNSLMGFEASNRTGKIDNALKILNTVRVTKNSSDIIIDKITGAVVVFDYNSSDNFVKDGELQLYFADKKYEVIVGAGSASNIIVQNDSTENNNGTASNDADNPHSLIFSRADGYFGATQKYMALVHWQVNDDGNSPTYESYGYGIAGFETQTISATGTNVSFTGKGGGIYNSKTESYATEFTVTATVDFDMSNVSINSSATMKCGDDSADFATCTKQADSMLDFNTGDTAIGYTGNAISGDVALTNDADFKGRLDARFYGTGTDEASEIGGTFSMQDGDAGYIGFFGVKKQ
ncbi:MAG: transferrin-binding protein-like solute binding protein [Alphaproteobacteria bacterium]|nr:transferrin-binding protein-like solute binding protein [Alphaproteobacteria bacterium]